jgi:outer membrane protein assembly factor BamB
VTPGSVRALWLCCAIGWGTTSALAQAPSANRAAVQVETSAAATRQVATIVELAAASQWDAARELLDDLERRHSDSLVEVSPRRAVRASVVAEVLSTQLDADEGRLGTVRSSRRPPTGSFDEIDSRGDVVARRAADAWEAGNLDEAAAFWSILQRAPHASVDPAAAWPVDRSPLTPGEIEARLALVNILQGDRVATLERIARLSDLPAKETAGAIAGREGQLQDILADNLHESDDWPPLVELSNLQDTVWSAAGNRVTTRRYRPVLPAWSRRIDPDAVQSRGPLSESTLNAVSDPLAILPAASGSALLIQHADGIEALDVVSGTPLWPSGRPDDTGRIITDDAAALVELSLPVEGACLFSPAVHDDRLFAVLGEQIALAAPRESRTLHAQLVGVDVGSQQGKLLWSIAPETLEPGADWRFSGPPTAADRQVFVAVRRSRPTTSLGIVGVDAATGEVRWLREVCGLLAEPPAAAHLRAVDRVRAGWGRVFLGGVGATACLDGSSGAIEWVSRDLPLPWSVSARSSSGPQDGIPPAYDQGIVFAIEHDHRTLAALDAVTGASLWTTTLPGRVNQLIGVRGGLVIAAGDEVWGVAVDSGEARWRFGFDDVEGRIHGSGLIAADRVLWCTREELFTLDLVTGEAVRRIHLRENWGIPGGHLVATPLGVLLSGSGVVTLLTD